MIQLNLDDDTPVKPVSDEAGQTATVTTEPSKPAPTANPTAPLWVVVVLVGMVCFLLGRSVPHRFDILPNDDRREDVTPVDPKPAPDDRKPSVDLKTVTLVVIHDKDVTNSTPEYQATLQDDQFAAWCKQSIKDLEVLTTEDELAKQVLAGGNFKVPVVIAYTGKKYLWDMPLPKENMEPVRKKLEGR
ncbi:MAG: hypothetical protein U0930_04845 [Pirellulales bacterium]